MRRIDSIVWHMTQTPPDMECGIDLVRQWHLERGFSDVGYHYLIRKDGTLEYGRPLWITGAHCKGKNANSIGIAYEGGWDGRDDRTEEQIDKMHELMASLTQVFGALDVFGHYEFDEKKTCPNFNPRQEFWQLAKNGGDC